MSDYLRDLKDRDDRINEWLEGVKPGDIVTVRLNSTDILSGKVYKAPDDSGRMALYIYTTLLRYGNGYPGGSFEPVAKGYEQKYNDLVAAMREFDADIQKHHEKHLTHVKGDLEDHRPCESGSRSQAAKGFLALIPKE